MNMQEAVQSQYLAALKMLKEAIVKCPPAMWDAPQDKDRFWYRAQHALYWAHRFLQRAIRDFAPWKGHRRPDAGAPMSRQELLEYLAFVEQQVAGRNSRMDLGASPGPRGFRIDKLEWAIASIRHVQQHTGELYERLGSRGDIQLHWTEDVHRKKP